MGILDMASGCKPGQGWDVCVYCNPSGPDTAMRLLLD